MNRVLLLSQTKEGLEQSIKKFKNELFVVTLETSIFFRGYYEKENIFEYYPKVVDNLYDLQKKVSGMQFENVYFAPYQLWLGDMINYALSKVRCL